MTTSKERADKTDEPEYEVSRPGIKFLLIVIAVALVIAYIGIMG